MVNLQKANQAEANSGSLTSEEKFRTDVNLGGHIEVDDTNFVKSNSGHSHESP